MTCNNKLNDIYRGDDKVYTVTVKDENQDPIDITGWTIYFTLKKSLTDSDDDALIKKDVTSHIDAVNGLSEIILLNTDTDITPGKYYYDIQIKDTLNHITTLIRQTLVIRSEATRRTT